MRPWLVRAAVAVLAVALGIGVGAGPLQRSNTQRDKDLEAQKARVTQKQRQVDALESASKFADAYAAATGPALVRGTLAGRTVALVTLPGADPDVVAGLRSFLTLAQGRVTAQVDFAATMGKASSRQLVEALTSQMLTQTPDVTVPTGASGYQRFGALLARAIGVGPTGVPAQAAYDTTAVGIISGLQSANLISLPQPVSARAGLALVVAGREAASADDAAANAVPVTILQALGAQLPTVVVGPTGAAGDRGVLGALRKASAANAHVSTVDSAETTMGQVVAMLALVARVQGTLGEYGAVGAADGALPGASH
jgi:hypothetical protein